VYGRNQCQRSVSARTGSNLVDMGRDAARDRREGGRSTPKPGSFAGGEATVKVCGVAVAMLPGQELDISLVDRHMVNVGTVRGRPTGPVSNLVGGRLVVG
jgi:hypothetical protein